MKALRFLIPLGIFLGICGFLAVGLKLDPREVPSPLINKPAPTFALTRLDDPAVKVSRDDLLGKVWMLNVWASWCVARRIEHPHLLAFARAKRMPIYGLNYKDERQAGQRWLAQHGDPYDFSLWDNDGRVGIDFGVYGVPETFVIDKKGVIRFKQIGPLTPEVIEREVIPLLAQLNAQS